MDIIVEAFVRDNVLSAPSRFKSYIYDDRGDQYHKRFAYARYEKYVDDFREGSSAERFIIASGLRGTGKTTIVAQLYNHLLSKGVEPSHILYISMDDAKSSLGCTITDIIKGYERFLTKNLETLVEQNDRAYLFIDEVHYDPDWSLRLKAVYDRSKNVFIFVTGSSAASLSMGADLARRTAVEKLFPLSYPEYNLLKDGILPAANVGETMNSALYGSSNAREAYGRIREIYPATINYLSRVRPMQLNEYLKLGSLPFAIAYNDERRIYEKIHYMLERVVFLDLKAVGEFSGDTQFKIMNLLTLLATSDKINYDKLASTLELSKPTLTACLSALEKADLIIRVWPHGSSSAHIRKTPKYKFTAPAVRAAVVRKAGGLTNTNEMYGALLEDAVAMYLHRAVVADRLRGFEFDLSDNSADFIITTKDGSNIVMEIGYGHKDTEQVRNSMVHCRPKYAIVVSDNKLELLDEENILVVPRDLFLLS